MSEMSKQERKLLSSDDLRELYRVTNPKLENKAQLRMVIRTGNSNWVIESDHPLRGYRACQSNLDSRVQQYENKNLWPDHCQLGIGIFQGAKLERVLKAEHRGYRNIPSEPNDLPLDTILGMVGLTRRDINK